MQRNRNSHCGRDLSRREVQLNRLHPMPSVVLPYLAKDPLNLALYKGLLENSPCGQGVPVKPPGLHDGIALLHERGGTVGLASSDEHLGQVDGDEHELVVEVPGPKLLPELTEDAFRLGEVSPIGRDPPFEPVEAKLRPLVREMFVDGAGSVEDGERLVRLAVVVQEPGEVVLGAELEPRFLRLVD